MKVENLELNKVYSNMRDMCEHLEIEYKNSTSSRKAIMKKVGQYALVRKSGRQLIVREIYKTKQEKIDKRVNNGRHKNSRNAKTIYADYVDKLILDEVSRSQKISCNTKNNLAINIGIVNNNYRIFKNNSIAFNRYIKIKNAISNISVLKNVEYNIKPSLELITESIERLQRKGYITFQYGYTFKIDTTLITNNKATKDIGEVNEIVRLANKEEEADCKVLEDKLLSKYNCRVFHELSLDDKAKYCKEFLKRITKRLPYVEKVWKGYEITNVSVTKKQHMLDVCDIHKTKKTLNSLVIGKILNRLKEDIDTIKKKKQFNTKLQTYERHQLDYKYILDSEILLNIIVNIECEQIDLSDMYEIIDYKSNRH